jgi:hypothetical protein
MQVDICQWEVQLQHICPIVESNCIYTMYKGHVNVELSFRPQYVNTYPSMTVHVAGQVRAVHCWVENPPIKALGPQLERLGARAENGTVRRQYQVDTRRARNLRAPRWHRV